MSANAADFCAERVAQLAAAPAAAARRTAAHRRHVHRRREHVVRRLALVDVVVRVHHARLAALAAQQLARRGWRAPRSCSCWSACPSRSATPTSGNSSSCLPAMHLVGGGDDGLGLLAVAAGRASRLTAAAARLTCASARISSRGMRSPEMWKFCSERCVCAPHRRSAGTSMGPKVSVRCARWPWTLYMYDPTACLPTY